MKKNLNYAKLVFILLLTVLELSACRPKAVRVRKKENDISLAKVFVKKELIIGVRDDYPPLSFLNLFTASVEGYDIELAQEICRRLKVKPVFKVIKWSRRKELLNNGDIDCIWGAFGYSKERAEAYSLTAPYIRAAIIFVVKDDSPYYSIQDIKEKKIGVLSASFMQSSLKKAEFTYGVFKNTVVYQKAIDAVAALDKGEVDCVVHDLLAINSLMKSRKERYRVINEAIASKDYIIAFRKGDIALMKAVESTLEEMAKSDFLEKTSKKWFDANISIVGR